METKSEPRASGGTLPKVLTSREVADVLRISERQVRNLAVEGAIKGVKFGNQWRFARSDVLSYLDITYDEWHAMEEEDETHAAAAPETHPERTGAAAEPMGSGPFPWGGFFPMMYPSSPYPGQGAPQARSAG